jgi:hypothetical protein
MGYRIAGHVNPRQDLTKVAGESQFARCIGHLFENVHPKRIIETGTYHGTGTTTIIANALLESGAEEATFYSIEVNPKLYQKALENMARRDLPVKVLHGLSVPRRLLPTVQQISEQYVRLVEAEGIFVDHEESDRAARYFAETDFPDVPDDLLGRCLREFRYSPDFVLLDSGGHMGYVEFRYLLPFLQSPCFIALDDIFHVKHHRSFLELQQDSRFELVAASEEKFGFCIAKFTPPALRD